MTRKSMDKSTVRGFLVVLAAGVASLAVAACDDGSMRPYGGGYYSNAPYAGGWAYDGWYDGYYGPIYDGYWGNDGNFYYRRSGAEGFRRGDRGHFSRGGGQPPAASFRPIHGNGQASPGMRMPHFQPPQGQPQQGRPGDDRDHH